MTEIRTERGDLVPEKYVPLYNGEGYAIAHIGHGNRMVVCGGYSLDTLISDLAHAEAKYAAAEQAWQKDAADKNKLVEMLTTQVQELEVELVRYCTDTRVWELEALLSRLAEDNAALRAQVAASQAIAAKEQP